jgi:hypothetical protein
MRYEIIASIIFLVLLASCSGPNQHLQKLSKEVYSQKTWEPPLPPNEFKSDGCSLWPDSEWVDCCVEHDVNYWMGGTGEERKQSDIALGKCARRKGHPIMSRFIYFFTRIGGVSWLPTPFRWGFGWDYSQSGPPDK